jgi:hypothetical protein
MKLIIKAEAVPTYDVDGLYAEMIRLAKQLDVGVSVEMFGVDVVANPAMDVAALKRQVEMLTNYPTPN